MRIHSYIDFPYGSKITWAPLYDLFIAAVALLAGAGSPSIHTIEVTTAVIPLLLGVLTVWLVFAIIQFVLDRKFGRDCSYLLYNNRRHNIPCFHFDCFASSDIDWCRI